MPAFTRRQYNGAAASTTITAGINTTDTTCSLAATTGWPSTAGVPFYVVIDPGTSAEEKCSATISGSTLTLTRAQDDTSASSHSAGATIYPVFTANDADEANELVSKLTTKGDLLVTTGSVLNRLAVGTNDYSLLADSTATNGVAWKQVPAAGLASDSVTTAKILDANVTAAKLASNAVETAKIADANVTNAKLANLTASQKTSSYILAAADRNTRIEMNSSSATTITVNTSLFSVSDVVHIHNIGSGITTITAGTATVTSASSLALSQWQGGFLYFTAASSAVFFPYDKTVTSSSGLVYITGTSFSAASSVSLPNSTFTATYKNYLINYTVTAASTDSTVINARLRASGTDSSAASYSNAGVTYVIGGTTIGAANILGGTSWQFTQFNSLDRNKVQLQVLSPQLAVDTHFLWDTYGRVGGSQGGGHGNGEFRAATQFDSLTLYPAAGTITGSYEVYGYALS